MTNYRPIDSKREEFRKYLERAGVMDALTKVLVSLYEEAEKPDDALDYVRKHLAGGSPDAEDIEAVKAELETSKAKIEELEQENTALKDKLAQYEGPADENPPSEEPGDSAPPPDDSVPPPDDSAPPPPDDSAPPPDAAEEGAAPAE